MKWTEYGLEAESAEPEKHQVWQTGCGGQVQSVVRSEADAKLGSGRIGDVNG